MAKNECEMRGSRKGQTQTNMAYFRNALTLLVLQYRKLSCFNGMSSETLGNNFARESKMLSAQYIHTHVFPNYLLPFDNFVN